MKPLSLSSLSDVLLEAFNQYQQQFVDRNPEFQSWFKQCLQDQLFADQLAHCWLGSDFAAKLCIRQPELFQQLVESGDLNNFYSNGIIERHLIERLFADEKKDLSVEQFDRALRQNRNREMLRIIWRDLNRLAKLTEITRDLSHLAEASIQQALTFHHQILCEKYGTPCSRESGHEQGLLVLGMGKLGAWELNLSSDIDLIFCYPEAGETTADKNQSVSKTLDNSEFFTRLARQLIQSLDTVTADGFVFRVDMRLRPYGESGALALSFDAMEEYYQDQGRDWERYAMIKARVVAGDVAGDAAQGEQLMTLLRPFTYRRYVDFSAVDSLRTMKKLIQQESKRRQLDNDVKLGAGGIREIEFIGQCFQLIRGGRDVELQERGILKVLDILAATACLPVKAVDELKAAYSFLRNTEHAIQAYRDQQTQELPGDEQQRAVLAWVMGFEQWQSFYQTLGEHRAKVSYHFSHLIADEAEEIQADDQDGHWQELWLGELQQEAALELLSSTGHEAAEEVLNRLTVLREQGLTRRLQPIARERLDQFMPLLLQVLNEAQKPSATFIRIIPLVEAVLRRTAYLLLLIENPGALSQLVFLCSASPLIAAQLARYPVLLDELLDSRTLYHVPEKQELRDELQQHMLRISWEDLDAQMEGLRYFKMSHYLRVSAAEVTDRLPLMRVSDYLTMIAEVILEHVLELAWQGLIAKHGRPMKTPDQPCDKDFIIVGYGKLGGIELGHGSDLDLVFVHDAGSNLATDGPRSIDNGMFFARLGQKIIHILTAVTASGALYEVDMRLRPSGSSGLLVTSLAAFEAYQRNEAWTWEHQALVRARPVAGDQALAARFVQLRGELLCQPRDESALKREVVEMREKMREHLLPKDLQSGDTPQFHLKHDTGAIVDIEFMVQYAVLAWSHQFPALAEFTDNIRILETLGSIGLFSAADVESLVAAYKAYRSHGHRLSLQQQPSQVPLVEFQPHRDAVMAKWVELMH